MLTKILIKILTKMIMRNFKDHVNSTFFPLRIQNINSCGPDIILMVSHVLINLLTTLFNFLKQRKLRHGKIRY